MFDRKLGIDELSFLGFKLFLNAGLGDGYREVGSFFLSFLLDIMEIEYTIKIKLMIT